MVSLRGAGWLLSVASLSACGLDDHGAGARDDGAAASGGVMGIGASSSGGFPSDGSWNGGRPGTGAAGGEDASAGSGGTAGGAGAAAGAAGAGSTGGTAGTAGSGGGAAGAKGGAGGAPPLDCPTLFAAVQGVVVCADPPLGHCKVAFGQDLGLAQSCSTVCSAAGGKCAQALDDLGNQTCVLPPTEDPIDCLYAAQKAVCLCAPP